MKSVKRALREGIYTALSGLSVPVYDGSASIPTSEQTFVSIEGITEGPNNTLDTFETEATVTMFICQRTGNSFSHDTVDDIEGEILETLIPDIDTAGFSVSGFQVMNVVKAGSDYNDEPGEEENISKIILRISQTLIEQ